MDDTLRRQYVDRSAICINRSINRLMLLWLPVFVLASQTAEYQEAFDPRKVATFVLFFLPLWYTVLPLQELHSTLKGVQKSAKRRFGNVLKDALVIGGTAFLYTVLPYLE